MNNTTELQKSYLAGFIDGEGYIGITFQRKKETKISSATPRYHPFLIIVNTNKEILDFIKDIIGEGKVYIGKKSNGRWKESYQYKLTKADNLEEILTAILPYLKLKNRQCEVLLDFIKRRKSIKPKVGKGSRGITSFSQKDHRLYQKLLLLNKRGI